jgi:hypothetical protein
MADGLAVARPNRAPESGQPHPFAEFERVNEWVELQLELLTSESM